MELNRTSTGINRFLNQKKPEKKSDHPASGNVADYLPIMAERYPDRVALCQVVSRTDGKATYESLTFDALNRLSNRYANAFLFHGARRGVKCLIALKPGFDFIASVFAVFKIGAIPVLIDPGMGRANLLNCVSETQPEMMIGIAKAHWARFLYYWAFRSIKIAIGMKGAPPFIPRLESFRDSSISEKYQTAEMAPEETAAILFTTGSTGPPKGVVYTHQVFMSQMDIIRETYGAGPDHVDLPIFPLFALFSVTLGMTSIIPDIDPSKPAEADPEQIVGLLRDHKVSFSFGSPALWKNVSAYCAPRRIKFPTLRRVLMAGAPVTADLHMGLKDIMSPDGETMVPYGATEALPITNFTGTEMLTETADDTRQGKGYCVGYPLPGINIRVIRGTTEALREWSDKYIIPNGEIGEIVVNGPVVTSRYYEKPLATGFAKIKSRLGVWHRMGDMGYFDTKGRLWFCGRKTHVVETEEGPLYTVCCEAIFNTHPAVLRVALAGVRQKGTNYRTPVLIVEPIPGMKPESPEDEATFIRELTHIGKNNPATARIKNFLFHPAFPVDIRHNAKIFREELSEWATKKLRGKI